MIAYPNPTSGFVIVEFEASEEKKHLLKLMDITGNTLQCIQQYSNAGLNKWEMDLEGIHEGTYNLVIESPDNNASILLTVSGE